MKKSDTVEAMDALQALLRPALQQTGFRRRARTFNRVTSDGLTHVINLQMGSFDPPGTVEIPGLRENLYGRFTVNVGVYVPEVARYHGGGEARSTVQEYHCCLRARLGGLGPERRDLWWRVEPRPEIADELLQRLHRDALPWLGRFDTRDAILSELLPESRNHWTTVPWIVCAIVLAVRGESEAARKLLAAHVRQGDHPAGHTAYVGELADRLGLTAVDG